VGLGAVEYEWGFKSWLEEKRSQLVRARLAPTAYAARTVNTAQVELIDEILDRTDMITPLHKRLAELITAFKLQDEKRLQTAVTWFLKGEMVGIRTAVAAFEELIGTPKPKPARVERKPYAKPEITDVDRNSSYGAQIAAKLETPA
jgi:hypothetical protein